MELHLDTHCRMTRYFEGTDRSPKYAITMIRGEMVSVPIRFAHGQRLISLSTSGEGGTRDFSVGRSELPPGASANVNFDLKGWV